MESLAWLRSDHEGAFLTPKPFTSGPGGEDDAVLRAEVTAAVCTVARHGPVPYAASDSWAEPRWSEVVLMTPSWRKCTPDFEDDARISRGSRLNRT